jgi:ABC-type transporter Mla MlaB component
MSRFMGFMLRITPIESEQAFTLKLEGKLLSPWVSEVESAVEPASRPARRTRLDLSELTFADKAGVELIHRLMRQGADIAVCSRFVSELLKRAES